jgi:Ca2+/Na+ antiporter
MKFTHNRLQFLLILIISALIMRFGFGIFLSEEYISLVRIISVILILGIGAVFTLRGTAKIIEETTEVLHERTHLAGGLLQSFGTAFPDMVLGIVAAVISLQLQATNQVMAINYAIIAAATTFGSNIYNIIHAAWCIYRQNLANRLNQTLLMFPKLKWGGKLKPMSEHKTKPTLTEFDTAISVSTALTVLTGIVALSMVLFGQVKADVPGMTGDLYQLIRPVGAVVFILALIVLFKFRKSAKHEATQVPEVIEEEKYYFKKSNLVIWLNLALAGVAILLSAEIMVRAIEVFCDITGLPFVIAGVLAGIIGCLGEMIVVHNFSVHPNGRIGDAVVGVAMDNIVTIIGASLVAIMGGIFLGGNALILIFVIILTANAVLIWQISKLKNYLL